MARKEQQKKASGQPAAKSGQPEGDRPKDISQLDTPGFRVFSGLAALLFLVGLLAMNDATTIWDGAEAKNMWEALSDRPSSWLTYFLHAVYDDGPISVFYLRFFGLFFFLLTLIATFFIGKKLFGKNTTWLTLLLVGASLLLPNLAKRAATDIYLFNSQLLFALATLIYLKSPAAGWKMLIWCSLGLSFILEPLGSLLFAIPYGVLLGRSHPQAKLLQAWKLWGPALAGLVVLGLLRPVPWIDQGISFAWLRSGYLHFLSWQLLAVLPFVGFVAGGIRDLFYKIKRGEEFSLVILAWILSALLAQSVSLSWVLALLAAKQMQLYFDPKYPFFSWTRAAAILQLILAFFVLVGGMIYGFWEFKGPGFRALLAMSGIYWGMSFLGVIGLYGLNHRLLIGGPVLAGVLLTVLFWFQVGPLLERKRQAVPASVDLAKSKQSTQQPEPLSLYYPAEEQKQFPAMAVYGLDKLRAVKFLPTTETLSAALADRAGILILEGAVGKQLNIPASADTISGWNDHLEAVRYQVIIPQ